MNCSTCFGALSGANSNRKVPRSVVTTASRPADAGGVWPNAHIAPQSNKPESPGKNRMLNFNRAVTNRQLYRCGFRDGCDGTLQKNGRVGALQHPQSKTWSRTD